MGTDQSGSCEWVELYNTENTVIDLADWTLVITNPGSAKTIALNESGSVHFSGIAGKGFYLLARKSTSCAPPISESAVDWYGSFGSGISNDGAVLVLKHGTETIDTVDASAGWKQSGIGGTNTVPKKTPQYTGSAWLEAAPTPRATNAAPEQPEIEEPNDEPTAPAEVTVGGTVPQLPVERPTSKLYISAIPSRIIFAKARTPYSAVVYDGTGKLRRDAEVRWAFGDGGARRGERVSYEYEEPGEYLAAVRATVHEGATAVALVPVVANVPDVSLEAITDRGVLLNNESDAVADISGWQLKDKGDTFTIPEDTVIAAGKTTLLPWKVIGFSASSTPVLLYPSGEPVT